MTEFKLNNLKIELENALNSTLNKKIRPWNFFSILFRVKALTCSLASHCIGTFEVILSIGKNQVLLAQQIGELQKQINELKGKKE